MCFVPQQDSKAIGFFLKSVLAGRTAAVYTKHPHNDHFQTCGLEDREEEDSAADQKNLRM